MVHTQSQYKKKLSTPQGSLDSNQSCSSSGSRSSRHSECAAQLTKARNYLNDMLIQKNMVPARKNMYKIVWVSEDRSTLGSNSSVGSLRSSVDSGDVAPAPHGAGAVQQPRYSTKYKSTCGKISSHTPQYMQVANQPALLEEEEQNDIVTCV